MPELFVGDSTLVVLAVLGPGPEHNVGFRVESPQIPPLFSIAVPKFGPSDHEPKRAAGDPGHDTPPREIQAITKTRPVGENLPDDGGVVAVDHSSRLGRGEAHPGSEHVRGPRESTRVRGRSVVEPVELDVRNASVSGRRALPGKNQSQSERRTRWAW